MLLNSFRIHSWVALTILFVSGAVYALDAKNIAPIQVVDAYVYVPLGSSNNTDAFFAIKNNSGVEVSIVKVTSKQVKIIELVANAKDAEKKPWVIGAGQQLTLMPSKQYLHLNGLKNSLITGDELQLDISLSNGKTLNVIAKAKSAFDLRHSY